MIRFFFVLLAVTILLVISVYIAVQRQWVETLPSFFFETLFFLLFGTVLLFVYLYRFNKPGFFVQLYLLTMAVKLLAYGAYNFFVILEDKAGASFNVAWFMTLYIIFTALEIAFLYRKISNQSER